MLKFKATEDQIKEIMANAYNVSEPFGLGIMHFDPKPLKASDFNIRGDVHMDYVQGRMVKLSITKEDDLWVTRSGKADREYQSWARIYPTFEDLIKSVAGIEIV